MDVDHLLSAYSDVTLLKEGGQKAAYRATDPVLGRVVVKIGRYPSALALERIRREVMVLQEIQSPFYPKNLGFKTVGPDLFVIAWGNSRSLARRFDSCTNLFRGWMCSGNVG